MKPIRVLIVEDSETVRLLLGSIIGSDPRMEVVASVGSAEQALELMPRERPDLITMDIRLPGMNGFEATLAIMSRQPTPVVVISASVNAEDLNITMNALKAGALCVIEKPRGHLSADYATVSRNLCEQLVSMSQVRVIRQRIPDSVKLPRSERTETLHRIEIDRRSKFGIIGMAASTGGPAALLTLFNGLPANFGAPILLVQHMVPTFLEGFVDWLGRSVPQRVEMASPGVVPAAGRIYVAPANQHLALGPRRLRLTDGPPIQNQRPSATVMFESLALHHGDRAVGVLLTGMGEDGALGMARLKRAGGHTLAEDATTAVVFGMPAAALALDGVSEMLPLSRIAKRLRTLIEDEVTV